MATKIDVVIEAVDNLSATVKKVEANVKRMATTIESNSQKVQRSAKRMSDTTAKSINKLNTSFSEFTVNARRLGALVGSFYAIRSAALGLVNLSENFKEFNEAMAYTNTIAQLTDESLADLTTEVDALSVAMGKSAPELARGLYDIYSSGFEGAEAMEVLKVATTGAIAGLTETATAAKGLMAVMNAYNRKTGADAVDIMDSMFKTVDKGVVTFEELASEIGSVVTQSSQLGIPFVQISAAMSEMTLRGISAAESATALEGLMRSLQRPSDQAKEATKKLGLEWNIAALRARGLGGVMKDLGDATQGNFEVVGEIIPEIRGMRAAMVLAANDGEGFTAMLEEQENRLGSTTRAYEEANKSINRQLESAKAEWHSYMLEAEESIARVQLALFKYAVNFAKWVDENKEQIIALADIVVKGTEAYIAYRAAVLAIAGITSIFTWMAGIHASVAAINSVMYAGITTATAYKVALSTAVAGAGMASVVGAGALGIGAILYQNKRLDQEIKGQVASTNSYYDMIIDKSKEYRENATADIEILQGVRETAEKQGDTKTFERAENLEKNILNLKTLYVKQLADFTKEQGDKNSAEIKNQIKEQREIVESGIKELEESRKLVGGLNLVSSGEAGGITIPEYKPFPTRESLLGADIDKEGKKLTDTIKKIKKDISEYYGDLGDFSNDHIKALDKEAEAFEEAGLKWSRYLEDIALDLSRMESKHKQTISDIRDDIADENRDFAESMDERADKFEDTMDKLSQRHSDKTEDLQHQLDLELGMGLRADQERIDELRKDLARENRDYAESVAEKTEDREDADAMERRDNQERLSDLQTRLSRERTEYQQQTDDIQKEFERRTADYSTSQNEMREKTQSTLLGITEDYQKAFSNIYDTIRDSGVPELLSMLPGLTQTAMENGLQGVDIPRNLPAEQEFVQNWGGLYGRLPSTEEISQGVYGTPAGPNNPVNVTINNPVVTDSSYIQELVNQINTSIGRGQVLAQNGAY